RNLNIHVPEILPPKTLRDMRRIRNGLAGLIQPALSVEATGGNDQRVAVPLTGRITQKRRWRVLTQLASIEEDLPPCIGGFIKNDDDFRFLDNLPGWRRGVDPRHALGQAVRNWILS